MIVNRVHHDEAPDADPEEIAAALEEELGPKLAGKVAENFRDYQVLARRDRDNIERLATKLDERRLVLLPYLDEDVHDATGLGAHQPLPVRLGVRAREAAERDRRLDVY